jgi:starch synthase
MNAIERNENLRIMMVSAEMAPYAKVGGLADVTTALSRALARKGHDVRVVLPLYGAEIKDADKIRLFKKLPPLSVRVGNEVHDIRFHMLGSPSAAVKIYLVQSPLFEGRGIYTDENGEGYSDSLQRAALHTASALLLPRLLDWPVDILHAHDAASAPALIYRHHWYGGRPLPGPAGTVLTIHNLAHQETASPAEGEVMGLPRALSTYPGLLEFHGQVNLLKGGILAADEVTTVSPNYAVETRSDPTAGCGLNEVLARRGKRYSGILNGGDYDTWDPGKDPDLPATYSAGNLSGKAVCRQALLEELELEADLPGPLCGFVSRLVHQKGVDTLLPVMERLAGDGFTFAILGTGEKRLEQEMRQVAEAVPGRIAFIDSFNEALAHRIYAGSDVFLMPSLFEPCGLSQMYALRYGTPPLVRRTGGLADTVSDVSQPGGTGFLFEDPRPEALLATMRRVEEAFADRSAWQETMVRGMACDFSWGAAAAGYEEVYERVLSGSRSGED